MDGEFADDVRLSFVVMRNELKKFFRGRKMVLFGGLTLLVIALLTFIFFYYEDTFDDKRAILTTFAGFVSLLVIASAAFFSATTLVSEFEERTALILFTKPIKKWSIFLGKTMASFVLTFLYIGVYYVAAIAVYGIQSGDFDGDTLTSFGLALCFMVAATGVAMLLSAVLKKSSTATIMTFLTVLLVFSVVTTVLGVAKVDAWWMLDQLAGSVSSVFGTFVEAPDETLVLVHTYDHAARDAAAMLVWGVGFGAAAYVLFKRRDF